MKFSQNTEVLQPNTIQAHYQAVTDPMAYGTGGKETAAMASAVGQMVKFAQKKQDESDAADLMQARNDIMTSLTKSMYGENGLMTTGVGRNAKGLTDRVTKDIQDTFDKISKNYNPRVQRALKGNLNENMANYQRLAAQQEQREFKIQKEQNYASSISLDADQITANYNNDEIMATTISDAMTLFNYRANDQGWGGTQTEYERRKMVTALLNGAIQQAIADGDYAQGSLMISKYGHMMQQDAVMKYKKTLNQETKIKSLQDVARQAYDAYPDDPIAREKYIRDVLGSEMETINVGGGNINTIDGLMAAISGQESGGNYDAENGRTGAHGKYQIMPENWPSWAEEAGLSADAPRTPENQEKVARFKLSQYLKQYGPDGAMVAWYSGPANAERWAAGESTDIYGRSWDAKNGNGNEPSIREYVEQVSARGNKGGVSFDALDDGIDASGVNLDGTRRETIGMVNRAHQIYKNLFGRDDFWVSCTTGGHKEGTSHALGYKADVGGSALEESAENRKAFQQALQAEGIGAVDEYSHKSDGWTGGHFDLDVRGKNWLTGENFGGFKDTSGSTHTRKKYTMQDIESIVKFSNAIDADNRRAKQLAEQKEFEGVDQRIMNAGSAEAAANIVEQIRANSTNPKLISHAQSVAAIKYGVSFSRGRSSAGGTGGTGGTGSTVSNSMGGQFGNSGRFYKNKDIAKAEYMMEVYNSRMENPGDRISEYDKKMYDDAARTLNDIKNAKYTPNVMAATAKAWEQTQDYERCLKLMEAGYDMTEDEAVEYLDHYLQAVNDDEEG